MFYLEIADSPIEHIRGLQYRKSLGEREGMMFVFDEPKVQLFWMKNTLIPLDFLWIVDNVIVGVEENVQPQPNVTDTELIRYSSSRPVDRVIELPAGSVEAFDIFIGDSVSY